MATSPDYQRRPTNSDNVRQNERRQYGNSQMGSPNRRKQQRPVYVEDLREKLNRKRREQAEGQSVGPPPDPPYNFLKDPDRDPPPINQQQTHYTKTFYAKRGSNQRPPHTHRRENNDYRRQENRGRPQKSQMIQPVNIKVQLATNTGERSCVVDEDHKLPEMKHVPDRRDDYNDRQQFYYRNPQRGRGRGGRGRGRGRGGRANYGQRQNRNDRTDEQVVNEVAEESWDVPDNQDQDGIEKQGEKREEPRNDEKETDESANNEEGSEAQIERSQSDPESDKDSEGGGNNNVEPQEDGEKP